MLLHYRHGGRSKYLVGPVVIGPYSYRKWLGRRFYFHQSQKLGAPMASQSPWPLGSGGPTFFGWCQTQKLRVSGTISSCHFVIYWVPLGIMFIYDFMHVLNWNKFPQIGLNLIILEKNPKINLTLLFIVDLFKGQ